LKYARLTRRGCWHWFCRAAGATCGVVKRVAEPFAPALHLPATAIHLDAAAADKCWLQSRRELFSCAESVNAFRVCPCRRYRRHQIALVPWWRHDAAAGTLFTSVEWLQRSGARAIWSVKSCSFTRLYPVVYSFHFFL